MESFMESLIEAFTCKLSNHNHFLNNAKRLSCCQKSACDKCIRRLLVLNSPKPKSSFLFKCPFCGDESKISIKMNENGEECLLVSDTQVDEELDRHLIDINHYLLKKVDNSMKNIQERLDSKEEYLEKRKLFIQDEIRVQVKTLKEHLDDLEIEMIETLDNSCKNASLNIKKIQETHENELNEIKNSIDNLKSNAFSYAFDSNKDKSKAIKLKQQEDSVNKCIMHLNDLNKLSKSISKTIDELRFHPTPELPGVSLIGDFKSINEVNLREQFQKIKTHTYISRIKPLPDSSKQVPISPRYICIADENSLLFTDSQNKQLVQLALDTGNFIRSTNLNGILKTPDGICVNSKTGEIYISDCDLNLIFKLDSNFNVLKKFGQNDLKWPRGIAYDSDNNILKNTVPNHARLYVCDPSAQRVIIYNEHEQYRDFLSISSSDEISDYKSRTNGNSKSNTDLAHAESEYDFCPLNIHITKTFIYVADDWVAGNCIRIFDKQTHSLLRNVGNLNCWNPNGLIVDDNGDMFTLAKLYYETGNTHLFCFSKTGELLYKTDLNAGSDLMVDLVIDKSTDRSNNRIITCGDKKLHYIQF